MGLKKIRMNLGEKFALFLTVFPNKKRWIWGLPEMGLNADGVHRRGASPEMSGGTGFLNKSAPARSTLTTQRYPDQTRVSPVGTLPHEPTDTSPEKPQGRSVKFAQNKTLKSDFDFPPNQSVSPKPPKTNQTIRKTNEERERGGPVATPTTTGDSHHHRLSPPPATNPLRNCDTMGTDDKFHCQDSVKGLKDTSSQHEGAPKTTLLHGESSDPRMYLFLDIRGRL
ncbi:uncharacterized protein LOC131329442 [Rhododendron vialii]|uniref:uncharacterized protein LOC131329442 n=1 Tax=Rhododendron vialii TaxID=182163 RepID=UPI00265DE638|nr:uncharacterized protein LOC131329442 [Rhododendron vialii]